MAGNTGIALTDPDTGRAGLGALKGTDGAAHVFASATSAGTVTPSDSTVLDFNAVYVGGAGDVSIDLTEGGTAVVWPGVLAGTTLAVSGVRVNSTGTTATNMVWMKW